MNEHSARHPQGSSPAPQNVSNLLLHARSVAGGQALLSRLDRTAPPAIAPDVSTVLTAWSTLGDAAGAGLTPAGKGGALSSGLATSPDAAAALGRVDLYVATHC